MLDHQITRQLDFIIRAIRLRKIMYCRADNRPQIVGYLKRNSNKNFSVKFAGVKGYRIALRIKPRAKAASSAIKTEKIVIGK